jgi:hypothetical protein
MLSDRVSTVNVEGFSQLSNPLNFPFSRSIHTVRMTSLRPLRFRRRRVVQNVEALTELLGSLTLERQALRASDAGSVALERNRVAIARAQWDLSHALIERHLPDPAAQNAA